MNDSLMTARRPKHDENRGRSQNGPDRKNGVGVSPKKRSVSDKGEQARKILNRKHQDVQEQSGISRARAEIQNERARQKAEPDCTEVENECMELLENMVEVYEKDMEKSSKGEPAMGKLRMASRVEAMMRKKYHRPVLLENNILRVFSSWLQMGPGNRFVSVLTRETVMDILESMPVNMGLMDLLDASNGLREILKYLAGHNDDKSNKSKAMQIVNRWYRFAKSHDGGRAVKRIRQ